MSLKQFNTYVIWNPEKVNNQGFDGSTYDGLVACETETQLSWSSVVTVQCIDSLVGAVLNETDCTLSYEYLA